METLKACHQFPTLCSRMERSSEMDDRIPGVDYLNWVQGKRFTIKDKENLQEGSFQPVVETLVTLLL